MRPLKSAVATVIGGIQYLYLSPDAGVTTVEDMSDTEFLMIGINPDMLGQVLISRLMTVRIMLSII